MIFIASDRLKYKSKQKDTLQKDYPFLAGIKLLFRVEHKD